MDTADLANLINIMHSSFITLVRAILYQNELYDINDSQVAVLLAIGDGKLKSSELKARGFTYYSHLSLVNHDYLTWNPHPNDKRSGFYELTAKGLDVVKLFHDVFQNQKDQIAKDITHDEFVHLITVLDRLDSLYVNETNQPRRPIM